MVKALDLRSNFERSRVRFPADALSGSDSGQVVHTNVPLSPSSIIWYLARAFMLMRQYVAAIRGSSEQGEYYRSGSAVISQSLRTAI